jgi:hypothetical protein
MGWHGANIHGEKDATRLPLGPGQSSVPADDPPAAFLPRCNTEATFECRSLAAARAVSRLRLSLIRSVQIVAATVPALSV